MLETHGVPEVHRWTAPLAPASETVARFEFKAPTIYLQISPVPAGNVVRIYFTLEAFNNDSDEYLSLDPARNEFYGGPAYVKRIWARGQVGAALFTAIGYSKKA